MCEIYKIEWLLSSICDYNDLPRVLDVLLVSLLHPSTARVSIQHFISKILSAAPPPPLSSQLAGGSPSKSISFYLCAVGNEDVDAETASEQIRSLESKVYAISNEGGQVRYHVNGGQASSSATTPAKTTPTSEVNKLLLMSQTAEQKRTMNTELPLSILNAASLGASGISLRINPFMMAKNGTSVAGTALDLGDSLASDDFDPNGNDLDESSKNARLLENYKAIKAGQMQREKEKLMQQQQLTLR